MFRSLTNRTAFNKNEHLTVKEMTNYQKVSEMTDSKPLVSVDFEVFGRVQGVFFRQYTLDKAEEVGVVGWVENTDDGTVKGTFQGNKNQVDEMRHFVSKVGSPQSKITKCDFSNARDLQKLEFKKFGVRGDW